ncbi:hypothetical protein D4A35_08015 [Paraclostridium bifermentans]|uniref:Uncharacterized protein n=1 Tax=Paraclostridium bifermentans TaxID=1490 RepID=A0A5P3XEX0_PARBF|nr:hypothetical protein [Paraclostridium bifermentans]QEZ68883.1 hypothetical protein D4A35_08015 [Paraclostridium bifermentans]
MSIKIANEKNLIQENDLSIFFIGIESELASAVASESEVESELASASEVEQESESESAQEQDLESLSKLVFISRFALGFI